MRLCMSCFINTKSIQIFHTKSELWVHTKSIQIFHLIQLANGTNLIVCKQTGEKKKTCEKGKRWIHNYQHVKHQISSIQSSPFKINAHKLVIDLTASIDFSLLLPAFNTWNTKIQKSIDTVNGCTWNKDQIIYEHSKKKKILSRIQA